MITLPELWLPIVLSAVFVFIVSGIFHMALPIHKNDFKKLPGEEAVMGEIRTQGVKPGAYTFPCPDSMKEMCSPEMVEKYKQGPVGHMTVLPNGPPTMGKSLVLWFLYTILVGVFVGYIGALGQTHGAGFRAVFRITGTVSILAYAVGCLNDSIWKGQSWGITLKFMFDGVIYGMVTAATFGWLWPDAP